MKKTVKNDLSRRTFIKKTALFTGAAATLPMLPSFAADTNAPDPNAVAAGASTTPLPATAPTVVLPPAPEPIVPRREVRHLGALGAAMPAGNGRLVCPKNVSVQ